MILLTLSMKPRHRMAMLHSNFLGRIRLRLRLEICRRVARRPHYFTLSRPIISFTFDDFPRNAAAMGGHILKQFGVSGTHVCIAWIGRDQIAHRPHV